MMLPSQPRLAGCSVKRRGGTQGGKARRFALSAVPSFIPAEAFAEIADPAARAMAARIERERLPVASYGADIDTAFVGPSGTGCSGPDSSGGGPPPVVLLHAFDSSCLEFRRLYPLLEAATETWAVDLVGWGFSDHSLFAEQPELPLTPQQKREHLHAFWRAKVQRPMVLVGASLGGAVAMDFALAHPEAVEKLVLVDSAGWTEPGMAQMPRIVAAAGVWVLRTVALRKIGNVMAYANKGLATDDAMRVGRLHTHLPGWSEANVAFIRGGGYRLASSIHRVQQPTLVLWGRQDEVIAPADAERFRQALPQGQLQWIESCGHFGHLEQARVVADAVLRWAGAAQGAAVGGPAVQHVRT